MHLHQIVIKFSLLHSNDENIRSNYLDEPAESSDGAWQTTQW